MCLVPGTYGCRNNTNHSKHDRSGRSGASEFIHCIWFAGTIVLVAELYSSAAHSAVDHGILSYEPGLFGIYANANSYAYTDSAYGRIHCYSGYRTGTAHCPGNGY
jgi:hypothetical protein